MCNFASELMKMNAAATVNCIKNVHNQFPCDMARSKGFVDLADMLAAARDLVRLSKKNNKILK
jgi:hypothetical protein